MHDGHQVAEDHAREGDDGEHDLPLRREVGQAAGEDPDDHREGGGLGAHGHERSYGNRRALVDVGRPHVEGSGGHLEGEADSHEDDAEQDQRIRARRLAQALGDLGDDGRARAAVDERHAVEHERAGEPADEEVLGRRLLGAEVGAREPAHDVEGDREQLQTEEDGDQRGGRGEHHHPDHRGHGQDVKLRLQQAATLQVGVRQSDRQDAEAREQDLEEQGERVSAGETVVRVATRGVEPAVERSAERVGEAYDREHRHHVAAARARQDEVGDDREQEKSSQGDDGRDLAEVTSSLRPGIGEVGTWRHLSEPARPGRATS